MPLCGIYIPKFGKILVPYPHQRNMSPCGQKTSKSYRHFADYEQAISMLQGWMQLYYISIYL